MGQVPNDILAVLRRGAMLDFEAEPAGEPLTGGVSSDIWRVDLASGPVCVKRALARLKVRADWRAPVERSGYEAAWIEIARGVSPSAAPELLYIDQAAGAVVMTFFPPIAIACGRRCCRPGLPSGLPPRPVGMQLARIHAATARRDDVAARFPTDAIFHDIRLEPYLLATARAHPRSRGRWDGWSGGRPPPSLALVHGDVSPKNILLGPDGPVFLDAECAWYGDPAFDLAFCLNHLLLKCLGHPP